MPPQGSSEHATISIEKAADIEFSYVSGEMRARTEFNRRVQNIQITLLTSIFVAPLVGYFTTNNQAKIDAVFNGDIAALFAFAMLGIITVNFVILLEIQQNDIYILMVTGYFDIILTRKYMINASLPAFEYAFWVNMLGRKSKSTFDRNVFFLNAHVILALVILFFSSVVFCEHQRLANLQFIYRFITISYFCTIITLYCYVFWLQVRAVKRLRSFITESEVDDFVNRYPMISDRIGARNSR